MTTTPVADAPQAVGLAPLCVDASALASLLGISLREVRRLDSGGKIPSAIALGTCKRWYLREVEDWLRAGAPPRRQWTTMRRDEM